MEWQQRVFRAAWHWISGVKPSQKAHQQVDAVLLDEIRGRLTLFARLLSGEPLELLRAEHEGGWCGHLLYLPACFGLGESRQENLEFYLYRVCYLTLQRRLGQNWPEPGSYSLEMSRLQARGAAPELLPLLFQEFPSSEDIYRRLLLRIERNALYSDDAWLPWGHWMAPHVASDKAVRAPHPAAAESGESSEPETTLEAPAREQVEVIEADREAIQKYTLQHYFEKVETIEEFQGSWRETDGSDDLSEHAEAMQEMDLRQVVRSDDPVHSVFQTEFLPGAGTPESRDRVAEGYFLSYAEWDVGKKTYRPDWCRVYPARGQCRDADYVQQTLRQHRGTLMRLRQRFSLLYNQLEQVRRQLSGEDLDLDALIANYADARAGCPPDERVYLSQRRTRRDTSILLLMDLSLSTDGYTGGQRILDVEKQAVILFAELLSEFGDRFQIDGFSSRTRHHCDYVTLKGFEEPWRRAAGRIGAAEPVGYTRIGPALRHATALLRKEPAASRWILLLSDGKPNDYDRYEGRYGLADVRQAIKEARRDGIQIYGLAVEAVARHYLPLMLGQGSYRILPRPEHLPQALAEFYSRLLRV
ncbi:MAG: hypothetical protein CVV53_07825 [Spirochaetae bacterium HGW-Spirochaetae-9]|nr:MAG: hypothetical protein CVV53_07825 [Spirochaetae bacterium HGW-Spirochaetae-9]